MFVLQTLMFYRSIFGFQGTTVLKNAKQFLRPLLKRPKFQKQFPRLKRPKLQKHFRV